MKISVIVPCFNQQAFIADTLRSVLSQQINVPLEILVGDDASTDLSPKIIEALAQKYPEQIFPVYRPRNLGLVLNMKDLMDRAKGDYIALLGGDDFFCSPDKLQIQYDYMEKNPQFALVHSDARLLFDDIKKGKQKEVPSAHHHNQRQIKTGYVYEDLVKSCFIIASTAFFRRSVYVQYADLARWYQMGFIMEDYPMWLAFSLKAEFGYIPQSLATYRIQENSASRSTQIAKQMKFLQSSIKVVDYFLAQQPVSATTLRLHLKKKYRYALEASLHDAAYKDKESAIAFFEDPANTNWLFALYIFIIQTPSLKPLFIFLRNYLPFLRIL